MFFLIFGETIITAPFAVCFLYRKDQHALDLMSKKSVCEEKSRNTKIACRCRFLILNFFV
ncbi:hypothetical protein EA147_20130 [Providencia stuartii]|nr:hypothetical protein EA147_20130 [Providencia stuartii]